PTRAPQPAGAVYPPLAGRGRNQPDRGPRSAPSGCGARVARGAPYLGADVAPPSPRPLWGSWGWAVPRRGAVAGLSTDLLPPGPGPESGVPASVPDRAPAGVHSRRSDVGGALPPLTEHARWQQFLHPLRATDWVGYAKPPRGGPGPVLKYLARYTQRVAIANRRLLALEDGQVTLRWTDYAHGNRHRTMTLDAGEFLRRFLLHSLPCGFQRIRHDGLLANRVRQAKLGVGRALLQPPS